MNQYCNPRISEITGSIRQTVDEPIRIAIKNIRKLLIQQIQGSDGVDPPLLSVPQPVMKHSWSAATSASGRQAVATQSP